MIYKATCVKDIEIMLQDYLLDDELLYKLKFAMALHATHELLGNAIGNMDCLTNEDAISDAPANDSLPRQTDTCSA
jgi:hypothetical protein